MKQESDRIERLISALEAQTNMMARLVQALDRRGKPADGSMGKRARVSAERSRGELSEHARIAIERALEKFG